MEPLGHDRGAQASEVEGERDEGQLPVPEPEGVEEEELEVHLLGFEGGGGGGVVGLGGLYSRQVEPLKTRPIQFYVPARY